jgi:hypothetical protein
MTDPLANDIERLLLDRADWVPVSDICAAAGIKERALRADAGRPGLLDHCAVSSTRNGSTGYIHHRFLTTSEWLPIKHRLRRHAVSELRRLRRWSQARTHILTSRPLRETSTGQLVLL